jgi:ketosteroid isomerase-like protein
MADAPLQPVDPAGLRLVERWIEARNAGDVEGMFACTAEDVEFHPLRLSGGTSDVYTGHDGVRAWFDEINKSGPQHELRIEQLRENGENEVLMAGTVEVAGHSTVAEFYGIYDIKDGLITRAHHYISDRRTMEQLGLIRTAQE